MNCTVHSVHHRTGQRTRLLIALTLAATLFAVEATASIFANSLALLAETFHVLIDVVALGIAFVAVWLGTRPVTDRRTFGLLRLEILATVLNTVLLLVVAAVVLVEGLRRFSEPPRCRAASSSSWPRSASSVTVCRSICSAIRTPRWPFAPRISTSSPMSRPRSP